MVIALIVFSLFIIALFIVLYQRSLEKTSLKFKTIKQLLQMREQAFIEYQQAKDMAFYGVMGHRAQIMCNIDKELSKKHLSHRKQKAPLRDIVKFSLVHTHKGIQG